MAIAGNIVIFEFRLICAVNKTKIECGPPQGLNFSTLGSRNGTKFENYNKKLSRNDHQNNPITFNDLGIMCLFFFIVKMFFDEENKKHDALYDFEVLKYPPFRFFSGRPVHKISEKINKFIMFLPQD